MGDQDFDVDHFFAHVDAATAVGADPRDGQAKPETATPIEGGASLPTLADILGPAIERAARRAEGKERPVALPWRSIAEQFGGGLWPGVHFLTASTGVGKTALALQIAMHNARAGIPVAYVGLELDEMQIALRVVCEVAAVPWSTVYLGKAGAKWLDQVRAAASSIRAWPFHPFVQRPQGWSATDVCRAAEMMRALYPGKDGPGSRPMLLILDFLQILGDEVEPDGRPSRLETRERIAKAAYVMRDIAIRFNVSVFCVSSVARDKYGALVNAAQSAGLKWEADENNRPVRRRVMNPDAIVGLGKESGDIEYAADSVSVLARAPTATEGTGQDMLWITAKGRATGASWSAVHFTGYGYREADDGGALLIVALRQSEERREVEREKKKTAKEQAKVDAITRDAAEVARYVLERPRATVREARVATVHDSARRWAPAVAKLAGALVETKERAAKRLTLDPSALPNDVAALLAADANGGRGHCPPSTPPPSTSTVDGLGPTVDREPCGPSTTFTVSTPTSEASNE